VVENYLKLKKKNMVKMFDRYASPRYMHVRLKLFKPWIISYSDGLMFRHGCETFPVLN